MNDYEKMIEGIDKAVAAIENIESVSGNDADIEVALHGALHGLETAKKLAEERV